MELVYKFKDAVSLLDKPPDGPTMSKKLVILNLLRNSSTFYTVEQQAGCLLLSYNMERSVSTRLKKVLGEIFHNLLTHVYCVKQS